MAIRVAIFEDNDRLRGALSRLVESTDGLLLAGAFDSCRRVVNDVESSSPDVVLMDIGLPEVSGIEGVRLVTERFPRVRVLMLTVHDDEQRVFEAVAGGASGYLLKKTPAAEIVHAVRAVLAGGVPMSPSVARRVLHLLRSSAPPPPRDCRLSERELEVLALLAAGHTYQRVADACFVSLDTVRTHVRSIYEKLHVHSKSEAVAKAIRQGLV